MKYRILNVLLLSFFLFYFNRSNNLKRKDVFSNGICRESVSNRITMTVFFCLALAACYTKNIKKILLLYKAALTQIILWDFFDGGCWGGGVGP